MTPISDADIARALIARLDFTNLNDDCTEADVADLCARAGTPAGPVAAICIWPRFVPFARSMLAPGIRIATVVNFPHGSDAPDKTFDDSAAAIADGADEIDMVIDHRRLAEPGHVERQVKRVKDAAVSVPLKAILETGALSGPDAMAAAATAALAGGADFLKTSTGKTQTSATLQAAEVLLGAIAAAGGKAGFKASGGIRSFEEAKAFRALAETICGTGWTTVDHFRIGASGVLTDLIAVATGDGRAAGKAGY
jgi:deoxyribose-phosphate aldolase